MQSAASARRSRPSFYRRMPKGVLGSVSWNGLSARSLLPAIQRFGSLHATVFPPQRYAHSRTRLLHLYDQALRHDRMQPSYYFRGTTATRQCSDSITSRPCSHMVSRRIGLRARPWLFTSSTLQASIRHPIHLHAGVCLRSLTLAHYSCRHRSPVSAKAWGAIPNSSNRPFSFHRELSPPETLPLGFPNGISVRLDYSPCQGYRLPPRLSSRP